MGDRIKFDWVTGKTCNVSELERDIDEYLRDNAGASNIVKLRTATEGGKNFTTPRKTIVEAKVRIPIFQGVRRFKKLEIKTDEQIAEEKKLAENEARLVERRRQRAERVLMEKAG